MFLGSFFGELFLGDSDNDIINLSVEAITKAGTGYSPLAYRLSLLTYYKQAYRGH